jgi:hypothetical protein
MTREEWLALPVEDRLGIPLDAVHTKPYHYASYAHHQLDGTKAQLTSVEVDVGREDVTVRLDCIDKSVASSAVAGLRDEWKFGVGPSPSGRLIIEAANSN